MTTIKYVSSDDDGTGDYICDGHADQVVINRALSWMAADTGRQVHMVGPFEFGITDQLFIGSNSIWSGDSDAVIKVEDGACGSSYSNCVFPNGTPVIAALNSSPSNIEIGGFQINGNCQNQNAYLGSGGADSHGSGVERIISFSNASGINLHNMRIYDGFGEGLMIFTGRNILCAYNYFSNLQHDAVFYKSVTGSVNTMHDNIVEGITSDCLRCGSSQNVNIYNNTLTPYLGSHNNGAPEHGENGIQISNENNYATLTKNINVYNNSIYNSGLAGIWILDARNTAGSTAQGVHIYNNSINKCGWSCWANWAAGITISSWGNGILIEDNTISGSYQQGIQVFNAISGSGFIVNTKNNNISNTIGKRIIAEGNTLTVVGYGMYNAESGNTLRIISENDYMSNNLNGDFYGAITHSTKNTIRLVANMGMSGLFEDPAPKNVLNIDVDMGMYGSDPTLEITDDGSVKEGDYGLMIPTADGHYTFQKFKEPKAGQKALIYPAHASGTYYLLRVAETLTAGEKIITIPDKNGKFWPILAK